MSQKQAKAQRQQARQVVAEFTIRAYTDGEIELIGPFNKFMMFREIMARAELAAIQSISQQTQGNIVVPKIVPPRGLKVQ